jgi:hypothetical protein
MSLYHFHIYYLFNPDRRTVYYDNFNVHPVYQSLFTRIMFQKPTLFAITFCALVVFHEISTADAVGATINSRWNLFLHYQLLTNICLEKEVNKKEPSYEYLNKSANIRTQYNGVKMGCWWIQHEYSLVKWESQPGFLRCESSNQDPTKEITTFRVSIFLVYQENSRH